MHTVYYLVHTESKRRIRYYRTQAGARIACRLCNLHLGFTTRVMRQRSEQLGQEYEIYMIDGELVQGTYSIEEDTIEGPDLLDE